MIRSIGCALALVVLLAGSPVAAQQKAPAKPDLHPVAGPQKITLGSNLATLDLPDGYVFLNAAETKALLKASNGVTFEGALGLIAPAGPDDFSVLIQFEDIGYVEDHDAAKLDANAIFSSLKEGNDEANEERKENGFPPLDLLKWSDLPHYDTKLHHVIWGLVVRGQRGTSINFNTRILGRKGVLSLNLVAKEDKIEQYKPRLRDLLAKTTFNEGQRYADFKAGEDKTAAGGITGLIIGGSALALGSKVMKLGILAKFSKFFVSIFLAFKKFFILIIAGIAGLFRKKESQEPPKPEA